jgi:NitT/TauT family transport system permease protein
VVSTATGLVSAKPEVLQLCRSLTASEWQMFRLARFPYAMPFVFAGMKVGVTMAMIGVIVGEFITAQAGLGYIIMFASSAGETATVLAAIVLLCGIGLALFGLVALGEIAVRRWYGSEMPVGGVI